MKNFNNPESVVKYGFTGMGIVMLLVFAALTAVFVLLMINVSIFFLIGVIIFGGYTLFALIWTLVVNKMFKSFE